ncbi:MAG: DUF814 domain-containing protein [Sandaracinaceae bacterium]|nr:DUF814 domain-containing protein [Sandaracinaceae bacterium]
MRTLGRITRIDRPSAALFAFSLRGHGDAEVLLLGTRAPAWGAGLVPTRPRGAPADALTQGLRRRLEGAEVLSVEETPSGLAVQLRLAEDPAPTAQPTGGPSPAGAPDADISSPVSAWLLVNRERGAVTLLVEGQPVLVTHPGLPAGSLRPPGRRPALARRAGGPWPLLLRAEASELLTSARRSLGTALARTLKRLTRKLHAIEADAARADHAPQLRLDADLLLAHGHQAQRAADGTGWVMAQDWSADPPVERRIPLERGERPADRAARLYHQARRLERGVKVAEERWLLAEAQLGQVRELAAGCAAATTLAELDAIAKTALGLGIREVDDTAPSAVGRASPAKRRPTNKADQERNPFRRFVSSSGHPIWVGRSARENDALTLHHAKPYHVWLHVEGRAGSHVIIPLIRGAELPSDLLIDAAHLAAHFSDARDESLVEVIYAERRHVVKPRGYPAGAVRVDRRKTLALRQEPARRDALLAGERRV